MKRRDGMPARLGRALLGGLLALGLLAGAAPPARAQADREPYEVSVWFRVLFGPDGKPQEIGMVDEATYPKAFADNARARVARASIPPPVHEGRAVTLRSGVELRFTVTPGAERGTVRLSGVGISPLPVKRFLAKMPDEIQAQGGWQGAATGLCTVGVQGRCTQIEVNALPGMPESVRRHLRASLERWEFEPQQAGGVPIPGEYALTIAYDVIDNVPEDFRQDKFQRLLRSR